MPRPLPVTSYGYMAQRVMLYCFGAKIEARREKAVVPMGLAGFCQKLAGYASLMLFHVKEAAVISILPCDCGCPSLSCLGVKYD